MVPTRSASSGDLRVLTLKLSVRVCRTEVDGGEGRGAKAPVFLMTKSKAEQIGGQLLI